MQEFLFGAAKNLGASALAEAVESLLDVIRSILQRECLVTDLESLRAPPSYNAAEYAASHSAMVAACRAVRACFDQLDLDARRATAELARHKTKGQERPVSRRCESSYGSASRYLPDMDLVFTQAELQASSKPAQGLHLQPHNQKHSRDFVTECRGD